MTISLFRVLALFWFCALSLQATAGESVYLECNLESTYEPQEGRTSGTTGSHLIFINVLAGNKIKLKKTGLGAEFHGIADDTRFFAETSYKLGEVSIQEMIDINRYTGSYENIYSSPSGIGLWHFGTCAPAQKRF